MAVTRSGPIPDASEMYRYGEVSPDFPDRILAMAESVSSANAAHIMAAARRLDSDGEESLAAAYETRSRADTTNRRLGLERHRIYLTYALAFTTLAGIMVIAIVGDTAAATLYAAAGGLSTAMSGVLAASSRTGHRGQSGGSVPSDM